MNLPQRKRGVTYLTEPTTCRWKAQFYHHRWTTSCQPAELTMQDEMVDQFNFCPQCGKKIEVAK